MTVLPQAEAKKANIYVLPFASVWSRTVDCNVLILLYTLFINHWPPKEITHHQTLVSTIFNLYKIKVLLFSLIKYLTLSACPFFARVKLVCFKIKHSQNRKVLLQARFCVFFRGLLLLNFLRNCMWKIG